MRKFRWWLFLFGLLGLGSWAAISLFPPPEGFGSALGRISAEIKVVNDSLRNLDYKINEASRADQGEMGLITLDSIKIVQEILWQKKDSLKEVWTKAPPRDGWVGAWEWMYQNADHRFAFYGCGGLFGLSILLGLFLLMLPPNKKQNPNGSFAPATKKNKSIKQEVPLTATTTPNADVQNALKDALSGLSSIVKKNPDPQPATQLTRKIPLDFGKPIPVDQIRMPKWESLTEGSQIKDVVEEDRYIEPTYQEDDVIDIGPIKTSKQEILSDSKNVGAGDVDDTDDLSDNYPLLKPTTTDDIHGTVFRMHRKGRTSREIARLLRISIEEVDMIIKTLPPI